MTTIHQLMNLKNRKAIITGATGNLGKVIASTIAELGADLVIVDKPGSNLDLLSKDLSNRWDVNISSMECDLIKQDDRIKLLNYLRRDEKGFNILVNNAALMGNSDLEGWAVPFEGQTIDTWRSALEINLTAIFEICQGLVPMLQAAEGSSIINIASIYGVYGPNWSLYEGTMMGNPAAYAVSKGGLIQFTRWLATTVAPNVRVNAISPGGIFREQPIEFIQKYVEKTPLKRMASEDDFRGVVAYLASDMSKYVTGQNLLVDGGWGVW